MLNPTVNYIGLRLFLFITALSLFNTAQAQNTETDSLKRLLHITKEDTARVILLEGLSYAYLSAYPDTAMNYALQGLQLSQKINFNKGEAICTNALGNVYFHMGDNAKALEMYLQYLKLKEGLEGQSNLSIAYFNIAGVYTEEQDYEHALYYLFKAKQSDEKAKDTTGILYDLYTLGSIYLRMHKSDSALYYLNQSYQLATRINDENMLGAILNTFGDAYLDRRDTLQARKYYNLSIPYAAAIKDNQVLTSTYYGLAKIYKQKGMLDSAIYYGRKSLHIAKEAPFLREVLETSTFLSNLFSNQKRFDSAFHYQQLSMATKDSMFNIDQVKKVNNLKFQEQQRQQAIETARVRYLDKVKLIIVVSASIIFLVTAVVLWLNNKQKQKTNTLLQQQKAKVELTLSELRTTQSQLIQSEKMASLGELTAGVAHEIQNPLNFINNFSEVNAELIGEMKQEISSGNIAEVKVIAGLIEENEIKINHHGKRADAIVKGMLQHSRTSSGVKEPTDINAVADEYLRLSYHGFRAKEKEFNSTINTDFDKSIGDIQAVRQDIGRVLLNLYNNAFYAVSEKKKHLKGNHIPTVTVSTKRTSKQMEIRISDNGNGIPEHIVDKIFQPFFTTKPTGEGTGLGLSLSYDIIKAHGGEIKVQSKEGEGSEFIVRLPYTT